MFLKARTEQCNSTELNWWCLVFEATNNVQAAQAHCSLAVAYETTNTKPPTPLDGAYSNASRLAKPCQFSSV